MSDRKIGIGIVVIAAIAGIIGLQYHEWWRDEARTWLLMQSSHGISDVWRDVVHGHPHPYYLLTYFISQLCHAPLAMSVMNLVLMLVAVALFVANAPFTKVQKLLFVVGFYPLFQYGIIARSYTLVLALLFLYCYLKRARPNNFGGRALTLILLAQIHVMSAAIVPILLSIEWWQDRQHHRPWTWRQWAWTAIAGASILFCAWQVLSPTHHHSPYDLGNIKYALFGLGHGFWPDYGFFLGKHLFEGVGIALWSLSFLVFRFNRLGRIYYIGLTATLLGISIVLYPGFRWHHGFYFIYFIAAIWLSTEGPPSDTFSRRFITGILFLHAAIGGYALADDSRHPYSNGDAVATYIQAHHLETLPWVGILVTRDGAQYRYQWEIDRLQPVLVRIPDHGTFNPVTMQTEPFWRHYDNPEYFPTRTQDEMAHDLQQLATTLHAPYLVIVAQERNAEGFPLPAKIQPIEIFPKPSDYGEHLQLYIYPGKL